MCGITGIYSLSQKQISTSTLKKMNDSLFHRGPDGEGFYFNAHKTIGLGHRRLSIIDLNTGGQPMLTSDGKYVVVFNGEIYNYKDLKFILEAAGYEFQTYSDTEVLLYAWKEWGTKMPHYLRGMFAFAIWDNEKEELFLCRDRLGKKPLYYALMSNGDFVFASELKAIEKHPDLNRHIYDQSVMNFFAYGYIPDPNTIYEQCRRLEAGHYIHLTKSSGHFLPQTHPYWQLNFSQNNIKSEEEIKQELIFELTQAVRLRQVSDVPIGCFLSGGVDSSGITALMSCINNEPITTFCLGFDQKDYNESEYAKRISKRYHTIHHSKIVDANDFHLVDKMIDIFDEPFGDSSAMPTYQVSALAREHVKVVLSGDGGDELFAGYRRYLFHVSEEKLRQKLPSSLRKNLFRFLGKAYPKLDWAPRYLRAKNTFEELALDAADAFFVSVSYMNDTERNLLFSDDFKKRIGTSHPAELIRHIYDEAPTDHPLLKAQYTDIKTWLVGDINTKVDRASMAASIETRAPLLDHKFLDWTSKLPADLKLRGTEGKYIFKKALEPFVDEDILYRPKMGFSIPMEHWFRGPLKQKIKDKIASGILQESGYFNINRLNQLVDDHISGHRNHSKTIWLLLIFSSFLEKNQKSA